MDKILNIANHIINICIDLEKPINYFTLQKILFLANEKHKKRAFLGNLFLMITLLYLATPTLNMKKYIENT